ncbi:MAG: hypothetical protein ABJA71_06920, partial [Ginsengibacter sp.]
KLHKKYKMYAWRNNKGYGTSEHRSAIEKHGLCEYHRKSFNIFAAQLFLLIEEELEAGKQLKEEYLKEASA